MAVPVGGSHDIEELYERAGFRYEFELFEDDETTPINFAIGSTGKAQMRTSEKSTAVLLAEFTVEIVDNKVAIILSSEDSHFNITQESHRKAYYDIFVTEPNQEPIMFMEGKITINPAVTHPVEPEPEP